MKYTTEKIKCLNKRGYNMSLSNYFDNVIDLYDAAENSSSVQQLEHEVNEVSSYLVWKNNRDTDNYTRLKASDPIGNEYYLYIYKDLSSSQKSA